MPHTAVMPKVSPKGLEHRTVWRWHFYAGLFCIPFVLWLSVTGTVFLFHPQIQRWLDRPYDHLSITHRATANAQVQAALAASPGTTLDSYELPNSPTSAAQILLDKGAKQFRVYVHPETLKILRVDNEDHRVDVFTSRLHGELLLGKYGSWIVELAGSWAVVMILTGLFLWWPTQTKGLGGILYPRAGQGKRGFWKDVHSVTGIYVSLFALFLLLTGLPWAKSWGGYLKAIRHVSADRAVRQDWTTSSADVMAARASRSDSMADMPRMANMSVSPMRNMPVYGAATAPCSRVPALFSLSTRWWQRCAPAACKPCPDFTAHARRRQLEREVGHPRPAPACGPNSGCEKRSHSAAD